MRGRAVVIGAGIFGVTAARELGRRGWNVVVLDPGPVPHPLAESTDISKIVRMEYGADEDYTALMEVALDGWRRWNAGWPAPLFHETGITFLSRAPLAPGGFEYESWRVLTGRGHHLERIDAAALRRRFPAWNAARFVDGYFNPAGGYAESSKVVAALWAEAARDGVEARGGERVVRLVEEADGARVAGVVTASGEVVPAEVVVVAAGSWTQHLLPWLAPHLRSVGQPVFHLRPADVTRFRAAVFPVFGADIARTGYYGFPVNADGIVKIANHGPGRPMHPESPERVVTAGEARALRDFLGETFPELVAAPIVGTRVCVYGDSRDGHFWIDRDPERAGLVVAAGGSGHGFKFAPVLGELIADAVEGRASRYAAKFRWRPEVQAARGQEAARRRGEGDGGSDRS